MIVTKDEFVKVDLELGFAHTMVGSDQPLLEVADGPVGKRDNGLRAFSQLRAEGLGPNDMFVADLRQARKALETVSVDGGTGFNVLGQEGDYRRSLKVGNHRHADSTGGSPAFFHSHQDQRRPAVFELSASSESSLLAANPRIVNLYLAAKRSARRIHHRPTKFVKHHPRRLVAGEAELPLQKQRRHSALVSGHQIRRPEPIGEWDFRPMEDGPRRQRNLTPALSALAAPLVHQFIGSLMPAARTDESIRPATGRQVLLTGLLGGEIGLKLAKRFGKRRSRHPSTLAIGAC